MPQDRQTLISSVQRALKLVDIVATAARPLPVKAIANAAGLSLGTAYNLTRTLVHEGYLAAEPDGLVLGDRFPSLRGTDHAGVFLARVRQTLRRVAEEQDATAYLARFSAGEVRLIDIVDQTGVPRPELWSALADGAHATALGKQILAQLSREQRAEYLTRHPQVRFTPRMTTSRRAVLNHLQRGAESTADREVYRLGHSCVAVPVRAPGVMAALAVTVPGDRFDSGLEGITHQLRAAAATLAHQLGAEARARFSI
ncbi:IclR family transcriptional regulator [Cryobacterium fucosi]|uniref:IclR family transcriptional regulator n=1 Tax=Cryobacterium fucosi TaxID=1259157 RepID=A0A4R9BE85_9MICO|nr:helix-turn-helix domain-containing protein [Cryobacterium fucosi]TFD82231.1 IclR family transcriptional regulator [Cryobacterium fucosi]